LSGLYHRRKKVIYPLFDGHWKIWSECDLINITSNLWRGKSMYETLAIHVTRRSGVRVTALTNAALILLGSLVIALLAQIQVRLPFGAVPLTGQTLGVLLVAAALGWKRGVGCLLTYLAEGALGLPVFAGGATGWAYLGGVTGGYLLGFVVAAGLVGWLAELGWDRRWYGVAAMFTLGMMVIYVCGVTYLSTFLGVQQAISVGFLPFLGIDAFKAAVAAALLPLAWKLTR
jgi:biotin transport system substrate-specific component